MVFALAIGPAWAAACSADRSGFGETAPGFAVDGGDAIALDACGALRCSRDLKRVETTCGDVVQTCTGGLGCANGSCVPACDSAAAAQGSVGCSFWAVPPDTLTGADQLPECFAVTLSNTWDQPVNVTADYLSQPLDLTKVIFRFGAAGTLTPLVGPIPPGELAVIFVSQGTGEQPLVCPNGAAAIPVFPWKKGTGRNAAVHFTTDVPATAVSIYPYGGASTFFPSATLLLPSTSWGTNYVAITPYGAASPEPRPNFLQIIAQADTTVRIRPSSNLVGSPDIPRAAKGTVASFDLARGEILQLSQYDELVGSPIEATLPIAVFGGATYAFIGNGPADALQQQIPALSQWGDTYVLSPHRTRFANGAAETVRWRVVGAVDDTQLTYDPAPPQNAPTHLNAGESFYFDAEAPVVVRSTAADHPFYAAAFMFGSQEQDARGNMTVNGDPDFVNVVPPAQYLDHYVFAVDPTYPESWIDLVRQKDPTRGFADVTLECEGLLSGWKDVDTKGEFQHLSVRLSGPARFGESDTGGACGYGRHELTSEGAFAVTVWGIGYAASYGYTGGTGTRRVSNVVIPVK